MDGLLSFQMPKLLVFLHMFGTAKAGEFKFCTQVGHINYYPWDDKPPPKSVVRVM